MTAKDREIARRLGEPNVDEAWATAYIRAEAAKVRRANIERMRRQKNTDGTNDGETE